MCVSRDRLITLQRACQIIGVNTSGPYFISTTRLTSTSEPEAALMK
jgi:hypothetical protein